MNALRPLAYLTTALLLAACGQQGGNSAAPAGSATPVAGTDAAPTSIPVVQIDGSSTVYPITEAVAEEYQLSQQGKVRVTVGVSGTGGGFKKFCRGEISVSNASRPILQEEIEACKASGVNFIELPVAFDALTIAVNPGNTWLQEITVAQLKTMWSPEAQGVVTTWKQVDPSWPDQPMTLFGPDFASPS
jgi:phosphate transport system substrate-binding protein